MSDPVLDEIKHSMLSFLENVQFDPPTDNGQLHLIKATCFLAGASIVLEMGQPGAGKPCANFANSLKNRREGVEAMMKMGGRIIQ